MTDREVLLAMMAKLDGAINHDQFNGRDFSYRGVDFEFDEAGTLLEISHWGCVQD